MSSRERPADRAARLGAASLRRLGGEALIARTSRGLSQKVVARAAGLSQSEVSRFERGLTPNLPFIVAARVCGVVGLDLVAKAYASGHHVRDVAHVALLDDFARLLHPSLRWDLEVPLPHAGDLRAWDGLIRGPDWRFAAEAETGPRDGQALIRRLQLKLRDGAVDGLVLLVRDTRTTRLFLDEAASEIRMLLPLSTRQILAALRLGMPPPANGVVIVPRGKVVSAFRHSRHGSTAREGE